MFDIAREIAQTLRRNKLRTFLTGFAVAWGIFMLIILLGVARGVQNSFASMQNPEGSAQLVIWPGYTSEAYGGYTEGRSIRLANADTAAIKRAANGDVRKVYPVVRIDTAKLMTQRDYASGGVTGVYPDQQRLQTVNLSRGRFINERDIADKRRVLVLHQETAQSLFGDSVGCIGERVKALGLSWQVVGVYSHRWQRNTYVPFTTVMSIKGDGRYADQLIVYVPDLTTAEQATATETTVRTTMAKQHDFSPTDESAVNIWNRLSDYFTGSNAMNILEIAIWVIGILTLLSGIVSISNIMFVSVRERTHEIGVRRAIGAKPRNILTQIVTESVAITTLFGYIGIVLGMAVMQVVDHLFGQSDFMKNPTVNLSIVIKVTIVLIVAGALAGLFPALKATKVKPVEALRDE